jgi:hypothetical protein
LTTFLHAVYLTDLLAMGTWRLRASPTSTARGRQSDKLVSRQAIPPEGRLPRGVFHRDSLQKSPLKSRLDDVAIIDLFTI